MIDTIRYGDLLDPLVAVPNGSHETALARARTSTSISRVLVKRIPLHELVREVLCSLLAKAVGLPVPAPYVLDVRRSSWSTFDTSHVFGSDYSPGRSLVRAARQAPATLDHLLHWPSLLATIAFDEWIANSDRTAGNLLYVGPKDFQLIDHGDALPNRIDPNTKLANRLARAGLWSLSLLADAPYIFRPERKELLAGTDVEPDAQVREAVEEIADEAARRSVLVTQLATPEAVASHILEHASAG